MRVAFFGTDPMLEKVSRSLDGQGFEFLTLPGMDEANALLKKNGCEMLVVDGLAKDAGAVCRCVARHNGIAVVLLVENGHADWHKMQSLGIHGYIQRDAGEAEMAARLRAVSRRCSLNGENGRHTDARYASRTTYANMNLVTQRRGREHLTGATCT
jgi:DNA-binding response OmpR family regulator